ncbi:hypothetical protein PTRA_a3161 [Pseudoalteromonas translucida KMM 520]|uniref:DUF3530 domain-containing protein n=1 Tax=Pseudoalteromonas translucida KMM 520 TaxID=1315283 RepID=A0A0U2LQD7_9GAMM|nr:DUF3530 family protein [Pseudoalteromonas translucida]ALS34166.1 hypothetical protein PTRA_a3161 [Pseudoalteromonas translucida KMM 520]
MVLAQYLKVIKLNVLLSCALLLTVQVTAAEHIAPPSYASIENNDIQHLLPNDEIKPILAGDTEFLTLYSEYMSADFRGTVLLIPDWQSSATNNAGMSFLRKELNNLGYITYAMTVPDINWQASEIATAATNESTTTESTSAENILAQSTDNESVAVESTTIEDVGANKSAEPHHVNAIEKVSDAVLDNYKVNLIARYEALYNTAMAEPNNIVVIAQGISAGVLLEHYAQFPDSRLNAFISLSSYLPNSKRNQDLSQTSSLIAPPLLDIYYANDNNEILMNLKSRQRWVNRNAKFDYRQRQLFGLRNQPDQHARLSKEIDGFLRRLF